MLTNFTRSFYSICNKGRSTFMLLIFATLAGCGGNVTDTDVEVYTGVFQDSVVAGLTYSSVSQAGVTNDAGEFQYQDGEVITFSIGGVVLGAATGASVITPLNLVDGADIEDERVLNILRLLQSLDEDNDPENGIDLVDAARDAQVSRSTLLDSGSETGAMNEEELRALILELAALSEIEVVSADVASQHFQDTLSTIAKGEVCTADFCIPNTVVPITVGLCLAEDNNVIGIEGQYLCHTGTERFSVNGQSELSTNSLHYLASRYPSLFSIEEFALAANVSILTFYTDQTDGWANADLEVDRVSVGYLGRNTGLASALSCGLPNGGRTTTVVTSVSETEGQSDSVNWTVTAYVSEYCKGTAEQDDELCNGYAGDQAIVFTWDGEESLLADGECRLVPVSNLTTTLVSGVVNDSVTGLPLTGVQVSIFENAEITSFQSIEVTTGAAGTYSFQIPVGLELTVQYTVSGYVTDSSDLIGVAGLINYLESQSLVALGSVVGQVISAEGCEPLGVDLDVQVFAGFDSTNADDPLNITPEFSVETGTVTISAIAAGPYTMSFKLSDDIEAPTVYRNVTVVNGESSVVSAVAIPPVLVDVSGTQVHFLVWGLNDVSDINAFIYDNDSVGESGSCIRDEGVGDINAQLASRPAECPSVFSYEDQGQGDRSLFIIEDGGVDGTRLSTTGIEVEAFSGADENSRVSVPTEDDPLEESAWEVVNVSGDAVTATDEITNSSDFIIRTCAFQDGIPR